MNKATAYANANIALVKYWGKNDSPYNIPAVSSLSMTLSDMGTKVSLYRSKLAHHEINVLGKPAGDSVVLRVTSYLEQVRTFFSYDGFFYVDSTSSVPIASGLASSAAFYAALSCALVRLLDLKLLEKEQSLLARLGSGSAARSIFAHFAGLHGGSSLSHHEAFAFPVVVHEDLDLAMVIVMVDINKKPLPSRDAMNAAKKTSPFFAAYVDASKNDNDEAILALKTGSLARLGELMEHSTLKMFATMWSATPFINYWQPTTLAVVNVVLALRKLHGPKVFFTMDAGPNVKILCSSSFMPIVINALKVADLPSTFRIAKPGCGAHLLADETS